MADGTLQATKENFPRMSAFRSASCCCSICQFSAMPWPSPAYAVEPHYISTNGPKIPWQQTSMMCPVRPAAIATAPCVGFLTTENARPQRSHLQGPVPCTVCLFFRQSKAESLSSHKFEPGQPPAHPGRSCSRYQTLVLQDGHRSKVLANDIPQIQMLQS